MEKVGITFLFTQSNESLNTILEREIIYPLVNIFESENTKVFRVPRKKCVLAKAKEDQIQTLMGQLLWGYS